MNNKALDWHRPVYVQGVNTSASVGGSSDVAAIIQFVDYTRAHIFWAEDNHSSTIEDAESVAIMAWNPGQMPAKSLP